MRNSKAYINKLHRIAETQKKLAWHHYEAGKRSTMFQEELFAVAKLAADHCREVRQEIRNIIQGNEDKNLNAQGYLDPNFWD